MKNQCTGCVVSAGTHKPAEALHQQIDEPQAEAMRGNIAGGVRCHDADACKFGQAPCPTPACCGCPVTHEGYTPAGAVMQIVEPEAKPSLQTRHELISLPVGFAWGLCGAAIAVICMKVFA